MDKTTRIDFYKQKVIKENYFPIDEKKFLKPNHPLMDDGSYQYDLIRRGIELDKSNKDIAIDIGANVGIISRLLCENYKLVFAFEPSSKSRACIYRNLGAEINNLIVYPFAVGNTNQETFLRVNDGSCGSSSLYKLNEPKINRLERSDLFKIDDILPSNLLRNKKIGFIKIDIQGCELEALKGAKKTINYHKPVIQCETMTKVKGYEKEINEYLKSLNYRLIDQKDKEGYFVFQRRKFFNFNSRS